MTIPRVYNIAAFLLVVLAITSYVASTVYTEEPALLVGIFALPAIVVAWWLSASRGLLLPRWLVNGLLVLALLYAAFRATWGVKVEVVAELVVLIQLIKIGDRRSPRDDAQILTLAVFLAIAAMLTNVKLFVGVQLIAFVPLLVATVMLHQLHSGWVATAPNGRSDPLVSTGWARHLRRTVALVVVSSAALALGVFVLLPRGVGENAFGSWRRLDGQARTGFNDQVKLGSRNVISTSSRIVLDLVVRESTGEQSGAGINIGSNQEVFYLRGAVLDQYDARTGTWASSSAARSLRRLPAAPGEKIPLGQTVPATVEQTISMYGMPADDAIFAVWRPVAIQTSGSGRTQAVHYDDATATLRRSGPPGEYQYTVWSVPIERVPEGFASRTPAAFNHPRIHEEAVRIAESAGLNPDPSRREAADDLAVARAIQQYLQRNFSYTLIEEGAPEGVDPIEHFLFTSRSGHCEYFAAAMVALCRSIGINARMIAGFVAAEFEPSTGRYIVRESNAHAWVEVSAGPGRWRRFDPTPPDDLVRLHRPEPGFFGRLRRVLESVEYAWNTSVVGFDETARQRLLGPRGERGTGIFGRLDSLAGRLQGTGPRTFIGALLMGVTVFLGVVLLAKAGGGFFAFMLRCLRKWRRRADAPPASGFEARALQLDFYTRFLDALQAAGAPKPAWRPPMDHLRSLPDGDESNSAAERVVDAYYRAAFAGHPLSASDMAAAERDVQAVMASRFRP